MRTIVLALAIGLLAAPGAAAATLHFTPAACGRAECGPSLKFRAAPGERNDVRIEATPSRVLVTDAGARLGGDCERVDDHTRRCGIRPTLLLGDGDDRATGPAGWVDAGDGNDVVVDISRGDGGPGDDRLSSVGDYAELQGGPGDDVLIGDDGSGRFDPGAGRDLVEAGGGNDVVYDGDGAPGADRLYGGGGRNVLSMYPRLAGGTIDLAAQTNSDGDALWGFDDAAGSFGDDMLIGHPGDNRLFGDSGDDTLIGGAGQDRLEGNGGRDSFDAGPGDDKVDAGRGSGNYDSLTHSQSGDSRREALACGDGWDEIAGIGRDVVGADCESLFGYLNPHPVAVRPGAVTFAVGCVDRRRVCRGTLAVRRSPAGRRPGRASRTSFRTRRGAKRATVRGAFTRPGPYEVTLASRRYETYRVRWLLPGLR